MSEARNHPPIERLQGYVEESLGVEARAQVGAHVSACPDCRAEVDQLRELFAALSALPTFAPAAGFADRVMAGVRVRRPAFAGAEAWLERITPRTTRGWAAAAAMLALPLLGATILITWLLSQPGVTPQGLWLMTASFGSEVLASGWQWTWMRLTETNLAGWLGQGIQLIRTVGGGEIGLAAAVFAALTAGSTYVLYQNLFRTDSRRTEHATYVF